MAAPLLVAFTAGPAGAWRIDRIAPVIGPTLADADRLDVAEGRRPDLAHAAWQLTGTTSHPRYAERAELAALRARQEGLARPGATCAALIPVRKTEAWWDLAQDERRAVIEERSRHIAIGLDYLPQVARRLHHSREIGGEPFDFLTWFEYAPADAAAFEDLVGRLRATEEWRYVDREVDIRLSRDVGTLGAVA
jgi:chlorite dismutase